MKIKRDKGGRFFSVQKHLINIYIRPTSGRGHPPMKTVGEILAGFIRTLEKQCSGVPIENYYIYQIRVQLTWLLRELRLIILVFRDLISVSLKKAFAAKNEI